MTDVEVQINHEGLDAVVRDPRFRRALLDTAERTVVATARNLAPKRTGAGAASIHGQALEQPDGVHVRVAWDRRHFYMAFQDLGTVRIPARRFLEQAAAQFGAQPQLLTFKGGSPTYGPRSPRRRQSIPRYGPEGAAYRVRAADRRAAREARAAAKIAQQAGG